MSVHTLNDEADLDRVLEQHDTAVVDFWAPWCPPCREFAPLYDRAAARFPELAFCRVNADEAKPLAQAFGVDSIPTLIVIRERIMIASQPGYLPEAKLDELLSKVGALDMDAVRREMADAGDTGEDA